MTEPPIDADAPPTETAGVRLRLAGGHDGLEAALVQRVRLFLKVTFMLNVLFTTVALIGATFAPDVGGGFDDPRAIVMPAGVTALNGLAWLAMLRVNSLVVGIVMQAVATIGLSGFYAWVTARSPHPVAPELSVLFAFITSSVILMLRSALVPSPAIATLVAGALSMAPSVYLSLTITGADTEFFSVWVVVLAVVIILITALTSWITYGMEERIWAATQLGRYRLDRRIGRGGMGEVYLATHALLRRPTAVKLLRNATSATARDRFRREVQVASSLTHPNTVEIYDYGRTPDGAFYFAMEYIEGASLEAIVASTGPLPTPRVLHVLRQTASALAEAHERGLVHRDVKPSNVMLCARGGVHDTVKLMDFGLVQSSAAIGEDDGLLGTPLVMAPEIILDPDAASGASDVYALGITAWILLAGRPPFADTELIDLLADHLACTPAPPPTDVPALAALIGRALSKSPDERPADARAFVDAIDAIDVDDPWTERDARVWWSEYGEVVRAWADERATTWSSGTSTGSATGHSTART